MDHGSLVNIYVEPYDRARAEQVHDAINDHWEHGQAYLREESPQRWRLHNDPKFADVIVLADPTYRVVPDRSHSLRDFGGDHGWDPSFEGMHAIFLAKGPRLPSGVMIGEINNVEVYPLMMEILGLPLPDNIDTEGNQLLPLLSEK